MRRSVEVILAATLLSLAAGGFAQAGAYEDGLAAQERGDYAQARTLLQQAADQGDAKAQFNLGRMYGLGQGGPADDAKAAVWFRRAADHGNAGAQFNLSLMYHNGQGLSRNETQAARWRFAAANQGYASAQAAMGAMYAKGQGVPKDEIKATAWYRKAAEQGDADGAFNLALTYLDAARKPSVGAPQAWLNGVMNNVFGPGKWRETGGYRTPERENQLRAEGAETVAAGELSRHSLGTAAAPGAYDVVVDGLSPEETATKLRRSGIAFKRLFPEGASGTQGPHLHVEPSPTDRRARSLLIRVNQTSDSPAQDGPPADEAADASTLTAAQNYDEAFKWFGVAARQGDARAQFSLGLMYARGEGAPKDPEVASRLFAQAAGQGHAGARAELAALSARGDGAGKASRRSSANE